MAIDLLAVLRLDDQMTQSLKNAAGAATVGFAAITAAAAVSVKQFVDFDNAIRKTGAIAGANAQELDALSNAALDLGSSTSKSATEVANAMTGLAAGGMDAQKVMKAMPGIIAASEASGESLAVASDTVSSALSLWSLEAEKSSHVADVLAKAANVSSAGITDLGYAFKYAGAPAAALGVTLEETAAAIGIMSNSGIDGSSAGTSLRASLLALNNPATAQAKIMKQLGFSVTDASGEFKSLSTMVGDMQKATERMTEADKVATLGKLVGTEAVSGFLALMKAGPSEIDKMTNALVNSGGAAEETAKQMMAGLGGSLEEMSGAIETVAIRVGERLAPAIQVFADLIAGTDFTPLINGIGLIGDAAGFMAKVIEDNWSKIGPILAPITKVVAAMAASFLLIGGAGAIFMALSAVIGFISAPIAAVALGIGALIGAFALLYDKIEPFKKKINDSFSGLKIALGFEVEQPKAGISAGDTGAMMLDEGFTAPPTEGVKSFAKIFTGELQKVKDFVETFKQLANGGLMTGILDRDKGAVAAAVGTFDVLKTVFESVKTGYETLKTALAVGISFIKEKFAELQPSLAPLAAIFTQVWTTVSSVFSSAWSIISPILSGLWSLLQIVGQYAVIMFTNVLVPALGLAAQAFSTAWSIASPILTGLALLFEVVMSAVKALWENVLAPFVGFLTSALKNALESLTEGLAYVKDGFDLVSDKVSSVYDNIRDFASMISNIKLPDWVTKGVSMAVDTGGKALNWVDKKLGVDGSHYNGLERVSRNGYTAELHKDEAVLPRFEADAYRSLLDSGMSLSSIAAGGAMSDVALSGVAYDNPTSVTNQYSYATYMAEQKAAQQAPQQSPITNQFTINATVREDADIDRITDGIVAKILEKRGVTN